MRVVMALAAVLAAALFARLWGIGFGLPGLYDPDEPIFLMHPLKLLAGGTLNPGWFGHPGTTTIYALALVAVGVFAHGYATGAFPDVQAFAAAIYQDPSIIALPGRVMIALFGVASVWLTWRIGRRVGGAALGLLAAALLALNPLHIQWSQVIRTDVMQSAFMLAALLAAMRVLRTGRKRDAALAGLLIGLATATKWPAALMLIPAAGAVLGHARAARMGLRPLAMLLAVVGVAAAAGLFVGSPYVFIDFGTVLGNLRGEARPTHLLATGGGFAFNLRWYLFGVVAPSVAWVGLPLAAVGAAVLARRERAARWVLLPAALAYLLAIAAQQLIWTRWAVPMLPFVALFAAAGLLAVVGRLRLGGRMGAALVAVAAGAMLLPMAFDARTEAAERLNDTRHRATAWAIANVPRGSSIAVEHWGFDMLHRGWTFRFPTGAAGCVDVDAYLRGRIQYSKIDALRGGQALVTLGVVPADRLDSCRGDYVFVSYYDRYRTQAADYPAEIATYGALLAGGAEVARFEPAPGVSGGPVVRVFRMARTAPVAAAEGAYAG